jgi:hypothetical protein
VQRIRIGAIDRLVEVGMLDAQLDQATMKAVQVLFHVWARPWRSL